MAARGQQEHEDLRWHLAALWQLAPTTPVEQEHNKLSQASSDIAALLARVANLTHKSDWFQYYGQHVFQKKKTTKSLRTN